MPIRHGTHHGLSFEPETISMLIIAAIIAVLYGIVFGVRERSRNR